jgi:hypothetical protein
VARLFTLAEARKLLPQVGRLLREAIEYKADYQQAERVLQAFSSQITIMGGMQVDRERILEARTQRERFAERLKQAIESIHSTGCEVKDLDMGLLDFPSRFRGQDVYLCWKLDEPDIDYWHGRSEGFAGRKAIDQDFVDHHEGGESDE